jgi:hypothetical protein
VRLLIVATILISMYSCGPKNNLTAPKKVRFYDFTVTMDFLDPFLGLQKRYLVFEDSLLIVQRKFSKKGDALQSDTMSYRISHELLDSIYLNAAKIFQLDSNNLTTNPITKPPAGDGQMIQVILDLRFRGDRFARDFRNPDTVTKNPLNNLYRAVERNQTAANTGLPKAAKL